MSDPSCFNGLAIGHLIVRAEGERAVRLRLHTQRRHANLSGTVHGGVVLSMVDLSLFASAQLVIGKHLAGSVTLDTSCQFLGSGRIGAPLDAVTEVLRETGRMVFLRGLMMQEDHLVASFTGTIRKPSAR
ncbi:PaaI family thioesterase [Novosphingobium flavum]|uniref:PaaI family thioesterase n=1 Tax=Novosphingobium flavum TaxID=1778672 RepID=A0A7X1FSW0_9SPHN|nr:PaaI family thioesterase [Novosphingobium flavum]MBC2666355.1 PaaI family thioesterase [Novosphingobium flavum]